ncbi:MAG: glycoside hydrolase family 127 protein [Thermomicrobiales bacterium]
MAVATTTRPVVVDTAASPFARMRPVPLDAVTIDDAFWAPRLRANRESTLPSQHRLLWETGRIANLLRAAGKREGPFHGRVFNDSDVYKWLEAASWSLAAHPDPALEGLVDEIVAVVEAAQRSDGYLNSYFAREHADERWSDFDQHEMYCAGHLFQAAVAHHRATGSPRLLDVAIRFADHLDAVFGPEEQGKRVATDGHPEVEMALVELARETGERRYLDLARFFLDVRGHGILGDAFGRFGPEYHQDLQPFRELHEIVGHAVRAVYLNAGAADIFAETGEPGLLAALHCLWESMTARKMYVSGGIGSRYEGESFGTDYELPNALAYTETCAAIGSIMWNWRMLLIAGEARYADLIERTLYNAMLPGVSLDGETYFYQNPLADDGSHRRQIWFGTACCPPNVARTLAALPGYLYGISDEGIWIHQYVAGTARIALADGGLFALRQRTRYPWDGEIAIEIDGEGDFALMLRVPAWCDEGAAILVDGQSIDEPLTPGTYAVLRRTWRRADTVQLRLPMPVRRMESHPFVEENTGRIALTRGPLLYCIEQVDNLGVDPRELALPDDAVIGAEERTDLLGGIVALTAEARTAPPGVAWSGTLYQRSRRDEAPSHGEPVSIVAIPYFTWANREPGPMRVWVRR